MAATQDLLQALRSAGVADIDASAGTRSRYATDASLYRVPPRAVAWPRDADDVAACVETAAALGVPITPRGAGTSIAGNAIGTGLVLDLSRHMNNVLGIDDERGTARVQTGAVHAHVQRHAIPAGWRYGPDPSTHTRCTIGGMIGNNACGTRALGYGRTADTVLTLDGVTADGTRCSVGEGLHGAPQGPQLKTLVDAHLATIRTTFGRFGRQVSGYSLEHLLPENGAHLARMLVGTEGTLMVATEAEVQLVRQPDTTVLVVLGFEDVIAAAQAVPAVLRHHPVACEGMDARLVDVVRGRPGASVPDLPRGAAWLFVELTGSHSPHVASAADALVRDVPSVDALVVTDTRHASALWRIREQGAGLATNAHLPRVAYAGWEDAAVPPEQLADYLTDFETLLTEHRLSGIPYGHFGDGCTHIRLTFDLTDPGGSGRYRAFATDAAELLARYDGSLSGEHGDGRARSELLPTMYSPDALDLIAGVKHLFDPRGILNPGVIVDPAPLDADLRTAALVGAPPLQALGRAFRHDDGDLTRAVHRCHGVGACRATSTPTVMCPSYKATRDEQHTTRGRARVLQDAVAGHLGPHPFANDAVADALDLCLSCKACSSDCPTGVDMAAYKSVALHQRYRGRRRPISHLTLGRIADLTRVVGAIPGAAGIANATLGSPLGPALARAAGVHPDRGVPSFATTTLRAWLRTHHPGALGTPPTAMTGTDALMITDCFTNGFTPAAGRATWSVLRDTGARPTALQQNVCCGLPLISTGQLDAAKNRLTRSVAALFPYAAAGIPIVGVEPSCAAVFADDAPDLLTGADAARAGIVAGAVTTLGTYLRRAAADGRYTMPPLHGVPVAAQPHCHHHAVFGWGDDAALLADAGADVHRVSGCCGMAGNFGAERDHYDTSLAVAGTALLPALHDWEGAVLADGFSCRVQIADLTEHRAMHLAQLIVARATSHPAAASPPQHE